MKLASRLAWMIGVSALLVAAPLRAETYPDHTVRVLVGFAPGGTTTTIGRLVTEGLSKRIGASVILENHAGADGLIAGSLVAKAPPDGYTLLFTPSVHGANPSIYEKMPYDSVKDFTPIGLTAQTPYVLVVNPSLPVHTVPELVAYLKANPGKVSFGSPGEGTDPALSGMLLERDGGVKVNTIVYKGSGNLTTDLIAGRISFAFGSLAVYAPFVKQGTLRALATTGSTRAKIYPDLPTMAESGFPNLKVVGWFGLLGPANLPAPIVAKLNGAIDDMMKDPALIKILAVQGAEPTPAPPQALADTIDHELAAWRNVTGGKPLMAGK